jgi:vacuolar protein sorting-associated protein 35
VLALNVIQQPDLENTAYDFMTNAFTIFEEDITDTEQKVVALNLIYTTLYQLTCFNAENFDTLCTNALGYSAKLLKRNLQCEATIMGSRLFYCPYRKDGKKVMDYLRKALKTAEAVMAKSENFYLLVKILNTYLFYFSIEAEFLSQ